MFVTDEVICELHVSRSSGTKLELHGCQVSVKVIYEFHGRHWWAYSSLFYEVHGRQWRAYSNSSMVVRDEHHCRPGRGYSTSSMIFRDDVFLQVPLSLRTRLCYNRMIAAWSSGSMLFYDFDNRQERGYSTISIIVRNEVILRAPWSFGTNLFLTVFMIVWDEVILLQCSWSQVTNLFYELLDRQERGYSTISMIVRTRFSTILCTDTDKKPRKQSSHVVSLNVARTCILINMKKGEF